MIHLLIHSHDSDTYRCFAVSNIPNQI